MPLLSILLEEPDHRRPVAFGGQGPRSHAQLLADVASLGASPSACSGGRWLAETEDAYRIAVLLLAAAASKSSVALPPNLQPGTLAELRAASDVVFADAGGDGFVDPLSVAGGAGDPALGAPDPAAARPRTLVRLFTSGSSGPGKCIDKALGHLDDEVVELERRFGTDIGQGAAVLATVPVHHLYGLLFRVLWPLAAGRPFARDSFLLPDELLGRVAEAGRAVIVSSPAHLRHLAASARLAEHAPRIAAVFSSGGPLDSSTALAIEDAIGSAPIEIFGSTETGGVASRRASRAQPSPGWQLFAPVSIDIDADGALVVTSPFVSAPGGSEAVGSKSFRMSDHAERDGDGFRLLGRSDRVAKIGEKSISLPDLEARLAEHELVDASVIGSYSRASDAAGLATGRRLGALVVLNARGRLLLAERGRRVVQSLLAEHLAERWDRIALPRRWRFHSALPADARGKTSQAVIEADLARPVENTLEPLLTGERRNAGGDIVLEFVVPRDLAYFDGHYDAFALVPGVVQIHWVMTALGRIAGPCVVAERMEAIKFKNVLRPAQAFAMQLSFDDAAGRATFRLDDGGRVFSSGRVFFAPASGERA